MQGEESWESSVLGVMTSRVYGGASSRKYQLAQEKA